MLAMSPRFVHAQEPVRRVEVGLTLRFMPTGWFDRSGRDVGAYPALGAAPFVDYRFNRYASIGFMPEFTLNVIPKVYDYPISAMIAASVRLKLQSPPIGVVAPYILLASGYSWLFGYGGAGLGGGAHGLVLGTHVGVRVLLGLRQSILVEVGYLHGFQREGGTAYAPSYLVIAAGWQMSF